MKELTVAELIGALRLLDGGLPAAVAITGPDGTAAAYPVTGAQAAGAGYGQQAVLGITGPGLPLAGGIPESRNPA